MCLTKEFLLRFYGSMEYTLRFLIHYRSITMLGYLFDKVLADEPWRMYETLVKLLGRHNAELVLFMLAEWLRRNGCVMDQETLRKYLSDKGLWKS